MNKRLCLMVIGGLFLAALIMVVPLCWSATNVSMDSALAKVVAQEDHLMGHGDAAEIAVAKVNGSVIYMDQLMDTMLDLAEKRYGRREITSMLAQKIKDEAMGQLIVEELAYQQAARTEQVSAEDIRQEMDRRIKVLGGESALAGYLRKNYFKDRAAFSVSVKRFMTIQRYIARTIDAKTQVEDAEIKAAYEQAEDSYFHTPEDVQVTKVIFFIDPAQAGGIDTIKEFRLKVVNQYDNQPDKMPVDGTFIVRDNVHLSKVVDKKLYAVAKTLGKNEISGPITVDGTAYLVQLTGYKPEVQKNFDMVKGYLRKEISNRKKMSLLKTWRDGLRKDAKIEIFDLSI